MSEREAYRYERLTHENFPSLTTLRKLVYPGSGTIDPLPFIGVQEGGSTPAIGYLAFGPTGDVAAYYGVFPMTLTGPWGAVSACQSGATMTAPDHRRRGLFRTLAELTYEECRREGFAFVFGFPSAESYPGFMGGLGWQHRRTMISYVLPTAALPLLTVRRASSGLSRWRSMRVESFTNTSRPVALPTSVDLTRRGGALRDAAFLASKADGLWQLDGPAFTAFVKVRSGLDVGDLVLRSDDAVAEALREIRRLAFALALPIARFHVSPGSRLDQQLRGRLWAKPGLPYGHFAFSRDVDPDDFDFTLLDYDTF